jgi:hypothetical protein
MNSNNIIYENLLTIASRYKEKQDNSEIQPFWKEIFEIDINKIAEDIVEEFMTNVSDWSFYINQDVQAIYFVHGIFIENCGYSQMFAVKKGMTITETNSVEISSDLDYQKHDDLCQCVFGFNFGNTWYSYINDKGKSLTVVNGDTSELENLMDTFNDLTQFIQNKGYLGLHLALQNICSKINFPKNLPFVIEEHNYSYPWVIYRNMQ